MYRCIMILDNWLICAVKKTSSKGGCRCYASLPASPFPLFKKCNYSPKCPWLIVDVYLATSWLGKNLPPEPPSLGWIVVEQQLGRLKDVKWFKFNSIYLLHNYDNKYHTSSFQCFKLLDFAACRTPTVALQWWLFTWSRRLEKKHWEVM